jgi:hypothetical protein
MIFHSPTAVGIVYLAVYVETLAEPEDTTWLNAESQHRLT